MISLKTLAEKLRSEKKVALFCHIYPDGDTIGSAVALGFVLSDAGVPADVYCPAEVPEKYKFLKGSESVKTEFNRDAGYTAYVAVDCADVSRLGKFGEEFTGARVTTYVIDHHISNTRFADYNYVADRATNAENVFMLAKELKTDITPETANALATGVVSDTGNFKHKNVTPDTLRIAAELVACGADLNNIYFNCFSSQSPARAKLFGLTMEKIRYFKDGKIALITITRDALGKTGAKNEETEGFIEFIMGIKGVEIGISVMETGDDVYKISLRSVSADVNAVARTFGGGGHVLASGCRICGEYEEAGDRITVEAGKYVSD